MRIRPAVATDLQRITDLWCLADGLPMMAEPYPLHRHELESATLLVAERDRSPGGRVEVVGFGAVVRSPAGTFLADLFVDPTAQSAGVGRTLLAALFDGVPVGEPRWTSASGDERAVASYVRGGFTPRWPVYALHGPVPEPRGAGGRAAFVASLVQVDALRFPLRPGEPVVRDADLAYWQSLGGVGWIVRRRSDRAVVGQAVALPHCPWHPVSDAVRLGPVVTRAGVDAAEVIATVWSAVAALEERADTMRLFVPGPHPALPLALEHGMRIVDVDTFCSSDPLRLDPTRVLLAPDLT